MVVASQLMAKIGTQGYDEAKEKMQGISKTVESTSGGLKSLLANSLATAAGFAVYNAGARAVSFLKDQLFDSVKIAMDHEQVMEQTAKVLKSTGDASGMTQASIEGLAASLEKTTFFGKDMTESGENMLLTFTNIGKDVFPEATKTMLDMSKAMGQDVKNTAIQMGKALNDPVNGITALSRVGVTFTDQQKQVIQSMVDSGNVAGAQKIILQELQREFGGSADATGSFAGRMTILKDRLNDVKEHIGEKIIPILSNLAGIVTDKILPDLDSFGGWLSNAKTYIAPIAQDVQQFANSLTQAHSPLQNISSLLTGQLNRALKDVGDVARQVGGWFKSDVVPALKSAEPGFASLGHVIFDQVLPALFKIRGIAQDVIEHAIARFGPLLEKIVPPLIRFAGILAKDIGEALKFIAPYALQAAQAIGKFAGELIDRLAPIAEKVFSGISIALGILSALWANVWPQFSVIFKGVFDVIIGILQVAWAIITGVIKIGLDIISGNWSQAWTDVKDMLSGIWDGILNILRGAWGIIQGIFAPLVGWFNAQWQGVVNGFNSILSGIGGVAQNIFNGVISGVKWGINQVVDLIDGVISHINSISGTVGIAPIALIPHLASGTDFWKGGLAMYGEAGPEIVDKPTVGYLPRGTRVTPLSQINQTSGGSSAKQPVYITFQVGTQTIARAFLPDLVSQIRHTTGNWSI